MTTGFFFEDLHVGQTATLSKTITEVDILMYSVVRMDTNPIHLDDEIACHHRFGARVAHGMLSAGLLSAVIGTYLPGPGTIYAVWAIVEITGLKLSGKRATLRTTCMVKEVVVIDGEACVLVPSRA
jgi:3-hydroxybutyryl-CoA dehydratase